MSKDKGKLHELLAVEAGLEKVYRETLSEKENTFDKKPEHFVGRVKTYDPFNEDEIATEGFTEHQEMVTTVGESLDYFFGHFASYTDAVLQKEKTNQQAKADLELDDGTVLAKDIPATFLLGLEARCKQLRSLLKSIPTLAPHKKWVKDASHEKKGVWKMEHPEKTFRTRKEVRHKVLYEATDKHPAQIEKWNENVNVGTFTTNVWSGSLSPAEKSELLSRLDELERAAKKARQRANCQEVVDAHIGKVLTDFLLGDLKG